MRRAARAGRVGATLAAGRARRDRRQGAVDSDVGPRPHPQHGREPPRLVHLAPARLGRADSGPRLHRVRRSHPDARARRARPPRSSTCTAPTRGTSAPSTSSCPPGLMCPACGGTTFERERDILDVWFDSGSSHEAVLPFRDRAHVAGRPVSRGQRSAPRLVPELAARRARHARPPAVQDGAHARVPRRREDGRKMSKSVGNTIEPQESSRRAAPRSSGSGSR